MLETAPSFSIYSNNNTGALAEEEIENGLKAERTVLGSGDFSFVKPNRDLIKEDEVGEEVEEAPEVEPPSPPMYLATGLGIRNGDSFELERENSEEYYREILEEYPNHPLVLKNYAHLLLTKGDLHGAEYYYLCASEAEPSDGEVMSQYAKLVWELHCDKEKALKYFEQSIQTAPEDSNVLAAYAKFLWAIDDEGDEITTHPHHVLEDKGDDIEKYYKRMIEANSSDPLYLKTYAQFLYQSKGDVQGAEEYYSRAILADPKDGEILSQYAKLVWEQHHDQDKALIYFERAIEAAPGDSNVLAAYASFLWAIDDDDDEVEKQLDSLTEKVLAACTDI